MKENKLLRESQDFALKILSMADGLSLIGQRVLADQLRRSGTSISANVAEGNHPQSRADMISKFEIALKEANETENWLTICHNAHYIETDRFDPAHKQLIRIKILLISSVRTLKEGNQV